MCSIFVYGVISVEKVDLISLRKLNERCSAGRQKDAQLAHSVCERGQVVEHKRDLKFKHFSTETRFDIADMTLSLYIM